MDVFLEAARSGRAKCRACGRAIAKGQIRLGERLPNPFADDRPLTLWFHPVCAAYKRPDALLLAIEPATFELDRAEWLAAEARRGLEHRRLPRIAGVQRAPTGRATCRCCREPIAKGAWRIPLVYYEEGLFDPGGFIRVECAGEHFGTTDVLDRLRHFSPQLSEADLAEVQRALARGRHGG